MVMKMPEGWKRLNSYLNKLSSLPQDPIKTGTALMFRIEEEKRICELSNIVNLMKEMAEALEVCHLGANVFDEKKEEYLYPCDVALAALKKFQEWK